MIRTSSVHFVDGKPTDKEMENSTLAMAIELLMIEADPDSTCELLDVEFHLRARRDPEDPGSTQVEAYDIFAGHKLVLTSEPRWKQFIRKILKLS